MNLLQLQLGILLIILAQSVLDSLLQLFLYVGTHIAHLHLRFLSYLVALFHQVATALLGRLRNNEANHLAIVLRCNAYVAVHDSLLNVAYLLAVPRLDGNGARIRATHVGYLVQRHAASV